MRKKFSERNGYKNPRETLQIEFINEALKNRLWNNIRMRYLDDLKTSYNSDDYPLNDHLEIYKIKQLYDTFFKTHEEPPKGRGNLKKDIKNKYFLLNWFEIYDFVEYLPELFKSNFSTFYKDINEVLEEENSGYRFVNSLIVQIIDEVEIKEIEEVFESDYDTVKVHLSKALELLSDRENPDYQNSIKESISAVESIVNLVSGKTNVALNKCFQYIPFEMDENFKSSMMRLYNWTSSSDGIRHASNGNEIKSSFAEAKYMVVSCSAFINYLILKQEEIKN
ncbi:AbiJ-NTD4 domain-containing protein [Aliarcobacter butzleri]|uniref:AbiJ-NTD4 domain-containing protein n=1 Tax=Aliarcobacter butzleri TaxID=28197 RepID=UPI003AF76383